jgi:hypothetical protein
MCVRNWWIVEDRGEISDEAEVMIPSAGIPFVEPIIHFSPFPAPHSLGKNKRARTCRTLTCGTAKRHDEKCSKPRRVARARALDLVFENSRFSGKTVAVLR